MDEIELDETEDMGSPGPPVPKRQRPSGSDGGTSLPRPTVVEPGRASSPLAAPTSQAQEK